MEVKKSETASGKLRFEIVEGDDTLARSALFDNEKALKKAMDKLGLSFGETEELVTESPEAPEPIKDSLPWDERELMVFIGVDRKSNMRMSRWAHEKIRQLIDGKKLPEVAKEEDMPTNRLYQRLYDEIVDLCLYRVLVQNRSVAPRRQK